MWCNFEIRRRECEEVDLFLCSSDFVPAKKDWASVQIGDVPKKLLPEPKYQIPQSSVWIVHIPQGLPLYWRSEMKVQAPIIWESQDFGCLRPRRSLAPAWFANLATLGHTILKAVVHTGHGNEDLETDRHFGCGWHSRKTSQSALLETMASHSVETVRTNQWKKRLASCTNRTSIDT